MDHEIEAAEAFIGLVDAVNQVEHFQAEIDDEGVEEVAGHRVNAAHIDGLFAGPRHQHVNQHHQGDARHHGGEDKHHRHERGRPPRVRLDRAEDEADVSVKQESGRDADESNQPAHSLINRQRVLIDVA